MKVRALRAVWARGRWEPGRSQLRGRRLVAAGAAIASLLAPAAQGGVAASLTLDVTFSAAGTISVTLPDGTPVGSPSGAPTVIPAGFYTLQLSSPGGCAQLPYFVLKGPGESILDNMQLSEVKSTDNAYFAPNSTYTWRNDGIPDVTYTFVTSGDVLGTAPAPASSGSPVGSTGSHTISSQDVVGSSADTVRGKLTGAVSAGGKLVFAYRGKAVSSLKAGRYTITVTDRSTAGGFLLEKSAHPRLTITSVPFVGKRSKSVDLTAGHWSFVPTFGAKPAHSIVVS